MPLLDQTPGEGVALTEDEQVELREFLEFEWANMPVWVQDGAKFLHEFKSGRVACASYPSGEVWTFANMDAHDQDSHNALSGG